MQNRSVLAAFSVLAVLDTAIGLHSGCFGGGGNLHPIQALLFKLFCLWELCFLGHSFWGVLWVLVHYLEWQLGQMHNKSE